MNRIDRCIQATLDYVNAERAKDDRPSLAGLPKGIPNSYTDCPIARALGIELTHEHFLEGGALPPLVREFTDYFDTDAIPELIDRVAAYPD